MPQGPIPTAIANKLGGGYGLPTMGKQNDLWLTPRHGKYYNASYANASAFTVAAGVTTSVGTTTTYTGLCLSNPAASTVNLVLQRITGGYNVTSTASITVIGLITGWVAGGVTAHTTPGTVYSNNIGGTTVFQGLSDTACTLIGTPVWTRIFTDIIVSTVAGAAFSYDAEGEIIIPPGGFACIGTSAASGTSGLYATMSWEEVAP